jgi:hypothetical protein
VRRLSVGDDGMFGRCRSRLERLDWRRRGGGGGGGIALPVLSLETMRWELRFDDDVRRPSPTGDPGSESMVLRRDDSAVDIELPVRTDVERWGSSVLDELALDVLMSVNLAPCRDRGGGGGDFATDRDSLMLGAGLGRLGRETSTEC